MAELKRWDMVSDFPGSEEYMAEEPDGRWVEYADVEPLLDKAAAFDAIQSNGSAWAALCLWAEGGSEFETPLEAVQDAMRREGGDDAQD